jgi:hypothetical protein
MWDFFYIIFFLSKIYAWRRRPRSLLIIWSMFRFTNFFSICHWIFEGMGLEGGWVIGWAATRHPSSLPKFYWTVLAMVWWERYDPMPLFIGLLMKFTYPLCVSERQHSLSHLRIFSFPGNGVPFVLRLLSPVREIRHLARDNSVRYPLLSCDVLLFKTSSSNSLPDVIPTWQASVISTGRPANSQRTCTCWVT